MSPTAPVPPAERNLSGLDFFLLWFGAGIALTEIWAGGLLLPLGLVGGIVAILLGHLIGNTPLALAGIIGSRHGVPSIVSTRGAMGVRGSYLPAVLNIIQLIGWTAVMLWVGGQAAASLTRQIAPPGPTFWIVIGGVLTTGWALGGHRFWKKLQLVAMALLLTLSIIMTYVVIQQYGWEKVLTAAPAGNMKFMAGLDLVIAMPISWLPLVADYSRYALRTRSCFKGTWLGYFIASSWMYVVGLVAAVATGSDTPDAMVMNLMASFGLTGAALLIVLISTFTTTFLDIYSNAISVLSLAPRLNERWVIVSGGALGTVLAILLNPTQYENFLLFIGAAFCPLFGIVVVDYFIVKRGAYEADELFEGKRYWYTGGFHVPGVASWLVGFGLYQLCVLRYPQFGASLPSMAGAAALYLVAARAPRTGAQAP